MKNNIKTKGKHGLTIRKIPKIKCTLFLPYLDKKKVLFFKRASILPVYLKIIKFLINYIYILSFLLRHLIKSIQNVTSIIITKGKPL